MGLQQSKDELLYQQVTCGNIEGVKSLRREGGGLEWTDSEGKTPLIVACTTPELYYVAKALIELGANINAYRPGHFGGTPLHHAAKSGLEQTINLLLQNGANALVMNDDFQTPLDIARAKGYRNIVRAIEGHVCLFSGWLKEIHGPGFLELLAPTLLSRRVWVVVLPCASRNFWKPFRLELAIYADAQDAQPRTIVPLWKANLEELNFNQPDPAALISDVSRIPRRWRKRRAIKSSQVASARIKLVPVHENEKQELLRFSNACKGIPQVMHPSFSFNNQVPTAPATAPSTSDDEELDMAINTSLLSASHERQPRADSCVGSAVDASTSSVYSTNCSCHKLSFSSEAPTTHMANGSECEIQTAGPSGNPAEPCESHCSIPSVVQTTSENPSQVSTPSAPPVTSAKDDSPINYPSIDMSPVDMASPSVTPISGSSHEKREDSSAPSCTICLDAPVEGACVPCGHMAGCMSCLTEITTKKWGCPVCRSPIDQVIRVYAV